MAEASRLEVSKTAANICSICSYEFLLESERCEELPFNCETCEEADKSFVKQSFCNCCISSHVRRLHRITDSNGYAVSVCFQHKSIHELFCNSCNVVLCRQCVTAHIKHEMIPVYEKCGETRKEVFKYINSFDSLTKDVKFQQQAQKDCLEALEVAHSFYNPEAVLDVLAQFMVETLRELASSDKFKEKINSLCSNFCQNGASFLNKTKVNQFDMIVSEADAIGNSLRDVLQNSDGMLVNKFNDAMASMDENLKHQRDHLKTVACFRPFHLKDKAFNAWAEKYVSSFLNSMTWPSADLCNVVNIQFESVCSDLDTFELLLGPRGQCFVIQPENETVKSDGSVTFLIQKLEDMTGYAGWDISTFATLKQLDTVALQFEKPMGKLQADGFSLLQIKSVFCPSNISLHNAAFSFVACFESIVYIVKYAGREFQITPGPEGLHPKQALMFYESSRSRQVNCLIYKVASKEICSFFDDGSFANVPCPVKPALITCNSEMTQVFSKPEANNDIMVLIKDQTVTIHAFQHGLRSVDALHFLCHRKNDVNYLLVWNFERSICVVLQQFND